MSVGIARGELFEALVGNAAQRDHLIQGELPGKAMAAEAAGVRDEVIVDEELGALIRDTYQLQPLGEGFFQIVDNQGSSLDDYEFELLRKRRRNPAQSSTCRRAA
ncbi:MAG: hypothetical protein U0521_29965 [Anaerolineae bacterium]